MQWEPLNNFLRSVAFQIRLIHLGNNAREITFGAPEEIRIPDPQPHYSGDKSLFMSLSEEALFSAVAEKRGNYPLYLTEVR